VRHEPAFWFPAKPTFFDSVGNPVILLAVRQRGADRIHSLDSTRRCGWAGTFVSVQGSYNDEGHNDQEFEALVGQHYGPLYRFALSLTRTEADACDLTQETFHVWATKGHQLQDRTRAKSWLFTTLHRLFLESRRRHTRFPHLELEEVSEEIPSVELDVVNRLDAQQVVELLGRVDAQFQAPVALFYLEDSSYNEIAEILEIPLGTVKSRIARGLAQLKRLLLKDTAKVATNPESKR
jgi:RNA polymerase sigma-70 factor (ECF subfamily)